jgi:hypothetical protein
MNMHKPQRILVMSADHIYGYVGQSLSAFTSAIPPRAHSNQLVSSKAECVSTVQLGSPLKRDTVDKKLANTFFFDATYILISYNTNMAHF